MIRIKLRLDPRENQADAALMYFADRLGMNVRDYIYQAAQEKTADLAKILEAEIKKAQQAQADNKESGSDIAGSVQTTESQSVQSSGAKAKEAVDDTRSESSEG